MDNNQICSYHVTLSSDIAAIKQDILYIKDRVCTHIEEGEKYGGYRDRLLLIENEFKSFKKSVWYSSILSGIIGALIAIGSKDILLVLIKWITG
jgi:hypothetical protein